MNIPQAAIDLVNLHRTRCKDTLRNDLASGLGIRPTELSHATVEALDRKASHLVDASELEVTARELMQQAFREGKGASDGVVSVRIAKARMEAYENGVAEGKRTAQPRTGLRGLKIRPEGWVALASNEASGYSGRALAVGDTPVLALMNVPASDHGSNPLPVPATAKAMEAVRTRSHAEFGFTDNGVLALPEELVD